MESSAHTPYFPSYEPGGYFIANNSKTNPTKKSKQAKTSIKSLNFLKMRQKFTQNLKNSVKFDKIKRLI